MKISAEDLQYQVNKIFLRDDSGRDNVQEALSFLFDNSKYTQEQIATKIGKNRTIVSRYVSIPGYRKNHETVIQLFNFFGFNLVLNKKK